MVSAKGVRDLDSRLDSRPFSILDPGLVLFLVSSRPDENQTYILDLEKNQGFIAFKKLF